MKIWTSLLLLCTSFGLLGCFQSIRPPLGTECDVNAEDSCAEGYQCAYIEHFAAGRCVPEDQDVQDLNEAIGDDNCDDSCDDGFIFDSDCDCVDFDECNEIAPCDHTCENTEGSYECGCDEGFVLNEDGINCDEIIDCPPCQENASCDLETLTCQCHQPGYEAAGDLCVDINECERETDNCAANANCTNTDGSFECICDEGYEGDGTVCTDINECENLENCSENASCINSDGTFDCECNSGFSGNGFECIDMNECETGNNDCVQRCSNTPGGYTCSCEEYYELNEDGVTCDDINECDSYNGGCAVRFDCVNNMGAEPTCQCPDGQYDTSVVCADIPEIITSCPGITNSVTANITMGSLPSTDLPGKYFCRVLKPGEDTPAVWVPCDDAASADDSFSLYDLAMLGGYQSNLPDGAYTVTIHHGLTEPTLDVTGATCVITLDTDLPVVTILTSPNDNENSSAMRYAQQSDNMDLTFTTTGLTPHTFLALNESYDNTLQVWLTSEANDCNITENVTNDYLVCTLGSDDSTVTCNLDDTLQDDYHLCIHLADAAGNTPGDGIAQYSFSILETLAIMTDLENGSDLVEDTTAQFMVNRDGIMVSYEEVFFNPTGSANCASLYATTDINSDFTEETRSLDIHIDQLPHQNSLSVCVLVTDEFGFVAEKEIPFRVDRCPSACPGQVCSDDINACFAVFSVEQIPADPTQATITLSNGSSLSPTAPGELDLFVYRAENAPDTASIDNCSFSITEANGQAWPVETTERLFEINFNHYYLEQPHLSSQWLSPGAFENTDKEFYTVLDEFGNTNDELSPDDPTHSDSIHLMPFSQKLTPFTGQLAITCNGINSGEAFTLTQRYGLTQLAEGGDHCSENLQCSNGMKDSIYWHSGNPSGPELGHYFSQVCTKYPPYGDDARDCQSITVPNNVKTCLYDNDTARGLNICNPYPASYRQFFIDEDQINYSTTECNESTNDCNCDVEKGLCIAGIYQNGSYDDGEEVLNELYCPKPHQYPAFAARGLNTFDDEEFSNFYSHDQPEFFSYCVSYPVDDDGLWILSAVAPRGSTSESSLHACGSDSDCAMGICVNNSCTASAREGDVVNYSDNDNEMFNDCMFPLQKVSMNYTNNDGEVFTTTYCGQPCDMNGANPQCHNGCEAQGDPQINMCLMPDWYFIENCNNGQEYLYFGGSDDGVFRYVAQGASGENGVPANTADWSWNAEVVFNQEFLYEVDGANTVRILSSDSPGTEYLEVAINHDKNELTWTLVRSPTISSSITTPAPFGNSEAYHIELSSNESGSPEAGSAFYFNVGQGGVHHEDRETVSSSAGATFFHPSSNYQVGRVGTDVGGASGKTYTGFWLSKITVYYTDPGAGAESDEEHRVYLDVTSSDSFNGFQFRFEPPAEGTPDFEIGIEPLDSEHLNTSHVCSPDPENSEHGEDDGGGDNGNGEGDEQQALSFDQVGSGNASTFSFETAPFTGIGTEHELTASFWVQLHNPAAVTEKNILWITQEGDSAGGGLQVTYQKNQADDSATFKLKLDTQGTSQCYFTVNLGPQGEDNNRIYRPLHIALSVDKDSTGPANDGIHFFVDNIQGSPSAECTVNEGSLWNDWQGISNDLNQWKLSNENDVSNFSLDDLRIFDHQLNLHDGELRNNLAHDNAWEWPDDQCTGGDCNRIPHLIYFDFNDIVSADSLDQVESQVTITSNTPGDNLTGTANNTTIISGFRDDTNDHHHEDELSDLFLSGPFEQMKLAPINLNGEALLATHLRFNDSEVFEVARMTDFDSPITADGEQILVGLVNPEEGILKDYFRFYCAQGPDLLNTKHMVSYQNRIYLNVELETDIATTCTVAPQTLHGTALTLPLSIGKSELIIAAQLAPHDNEWTLNMFTIDDPIIDMSAGTLDGPNNPYIVFTEFDGENTLQKSKLKIILDPFSTPTSELISEIDHALKPVVAAYSSDIVWAYSKDDSGSNEKRSFYSYCHYNLTNQDFSCSGDSEGNRMLDITQNSQADSNLEVTDIQLNAPMGQLDTVFMAFKHNTSALFNFYHFNNNSDSLNFRSTNNHSLPLDTVFVLDPGDAQVMAMNSSSSSTTKTFSLTSFELEESDNSTFSVAQGVPNTLSIPQYTTASTIAMSCVPKPGAETLFSFGGISGSGDTYLSMDTPEGEKTFEVPNETLQASSNHGFLFFVRP